MTDEEVAGDGLAGRVHALTRRNLFIVVVLFVASIVTAVSTLATAYGVLVKSAADWRPAEYRKLSSLRGGHTVERFTQVLGPASYRVPFPDFAPDVEVPGVDKAKLVKYVFRPREDYRVEIIAEPGGSSLVYTVTSCHPAFRPSFEVDRNSKDAFAVTLGTSLAAVRPQNQEVYLWMTKTGARETALSQRASTGDQDGDRTYAWGSNDVCPLTSDKERMASESFGRSWEAWQRGRTPDDHDVHTGNRGDPNTRTLMEQATVNVYAETQPGGTIWEYYPALLGVNRRNAD